MIIDWYTVVFQLVNFLILVFLLRRFLYGPIIRAMDERERKIVEREEIAIEKAKKASEEARAYQEKLQALRSQEEDLLAEARSAADSERRSLAEAARLEISQLRQRWEEALDRERESFIRELRRQVALQAGVIARRCLRDLADADLQGMIWDVFTRKIEALPQEDISLLREALAKERLVRVVGTFEVSSERLSKLEEGLARMLSRRVDVEYAVEPGLICGLELRVGSYRLAWNVEDYLAGVEEQVLEALGRAVQVKEEARDA